MATTKLYKLDNGNSYATNCFPARNILRTSEEGAGHWLVAHKAAQKTKFEAVICAKSLQDEVGGTLQYLAELQHHGYMDEMVQENILDGPFLIKLHCVKIPSDLCSVDISNKNLVSAKEDDFEQFDSVAYINATENLLTLEAFRTFSGLRELELSLNGLRNLKISAGDFLHLEILDLSYNNLSPEDVRRLGVLSQLKVLHLTANGLRSLPSDLAVSENDSPSCLRFPSLEVLLLDDNDLSHPSVFVSLANLRSLKQLNLDKNGIAEVPYLHQMENSQFSLHPQLAKMGTKAEPCSFPSRFGQKHEQPLQAGAGLQGQLVTEKEQLEYLILQNHQDPDRTEVVFTSVSREPPLLDVFMEGNDHSCLADSGTLPASSRNTLSQEFMPPLPELRYLSLANNKVTSHVPKVPKQPLMLEAPLESSFWKLWSDTEGGKLEEPEEGSHRLNRSDPLPPIRPSSAQQHQEPYDDAKMLGSHREVPEKEKCDSKLGPDSAGDDIALFFLTQLDDADDIPSSVWRHELEERQGKRKHKPRTSGSCTYIPTKYKGYEELLRVKTDPEFIEPVGMQQNVQALRRALKQPLVYRDSKARLDSVQKPYVPRKKKMGKPPGPPSQKTKAEVLEDILLAMRGNMNIIEVPLVSVLQKKKSNRKEYQEALGLMKEFHKKYKAALATSNKAICKESVNIPALGQSPTQETFVEIEESKSDSLPQVTDESESLKHYLSLEKSSSRKRSVVTFAL
ncbi:X-ray radiation resistance-associated protein 1 isoform X4 [Malaclemys terrapin pileata]|uniref:X-ray radiation resistance-associated protein 1 isoform X4 n=1 Tax=Malaclemys terrapin pileata TaxID=2991368 RepID=UPI0023A8E4BF|nr:X-ray radiation resistance-associated protein 1 isoform X4 [Malaclemys terrapin pileata]